MKVLVNASTLVVGGGIQIGISFIEEAIAESRFKWHFVISPAIMKALPYTLKDEANFTVIETSPAKIIKGYKGRHEIKKLCREWAPDLIYSIGFPSYISFDKIEIGRYTNPWEINLDILPWEVYPSLLDRIRIQLGIWYRQYWAKKAAYIETQTEAAKLGIVKRLGFQSNKVMVVPNSPNPIFISSDSVVDLAETNSSLKVFCLAAAYPHKYLIFIPEVAYNLKEIYGVEPTFYVTIPESGKLWKDLFVRSIELGVGHQILNLGVLDLEACKKQYSASDLVFLPTLLEVFSATYVEAMAMGVPIVTTDLAFARDNCGDGARYFERHNAEDAASKIYEVLTDKNLRFDLIGKGKEKLNTYPGIKQKYNALFNWFEQIIKAKNESI